MDRCYPSTHADTGHTLSADTPTTNVCAAPTASPEQLSEPE